jgi:hypothetical protein
MGYNCYIICVVGKGSSRQNNVRRVCKVMVVLAVWGWFVRGRPWGCLDPVRSSVCKGYGYALQGLAGVLRVNDDGDLSDSSYGAQVYYDGLSFVM